MFKLSINWSLAVLYILSIGNQDTNDIGQQNSPFLFFGRQTSIDEFSSTFYAAIRVVYRIFLRLGFKDTEEFKHAHAK
jgi:hypothetical protein